MPYSKYQYVAKVAELQSISKAAAKLFISQPALTRIILNIETELGTTLFNRSVLPIQLTCAGKRYRVLLSLSCCRDGHHFCNAICHALYTAGCCAGHCRRVDQCCL